MLLTTETYANPVEPLCWLGTDDAPAGLFPAPNPHDSTHKSKRTRVLVIDDEPAIADSLMEILNGQGYEAVACYDGKSAIDAARAECPDLVLTDIVMPRMNGIDTAIAIQDLCPSARVVLFSGQARAVDVLAQARAKGRQFELLPKPIHPELLLKKLSSRR